MRKDRIKLPDIHYKITKSPDNTFNVFIREDVKLLGIKTCTKWTLLQSGFIQIAFCAEKFIMRRHYKSNEWEWGHRFTGGNDKAGIVERVRCKWDKETDENDYEPDMLIPHLSIDLTEIDNCDLHNYTHGTFDDYLNDKQDWIDAKKIYLAKFKTKCTSRLLALDAIFINCPRGHPKEKEIYAASNLYQGTQKSSDDWDIIEKQDIKFQDFASFVNRKCENLYDWRDYSEIMYGIFDINVEAFKSGKSANATVLVARKFVKKQLELIESEI